MNLSCRKRCRIFESLANLKCPNCFSIEAYGDEHAVCDCRVRMRAELKFVWE